MEELLTSSPKFNDWPIILEGRVVGQLNGHQLEGYAHTAVDPESNVYATMIAVNDIPELGNALMAVSSSSVKMSVGGLFAPAQEGAVNLVSVMGMPCRVDAFYNHMNDDGKHIGQVQQSIEIDEVGPGRYSATPEFEGWYDGPRDIQWSPGYAIYLRQEGPGLIEGLYAQTIFADSGRVHALVRRRYHYNTENVLPFDQVWHYKLLKNVDVHVENGLRVFETRISAYYSPAEAKHETFPEEFYRQQVPGAQSRVNVSVQ